ncbi:hypothetical protein BFJ65_g11956 [Fusarium oxysporum f. sp. cepae]|uniref:Uncharacterized protein n=1 Tax=Fusarium oxysporum f. sp. cepae TaxID=396571 RepID=A0A3L6N6J8_FUSOX|nr:hypothetical protein BFJ65_g11956 [Fusarium oxysporum f. sp. cepae]
MGLDSFHYNADHQVIVCRLCGTCLVPKQASWRSHLRAEPHRMKGDELRLTVERFLSYELRTVEALRQWRADRKRPCRPIEGLTMYGGYICTCTEVQCDYCTRRARKMHDHMPVHGRKASEHTNAMPLWRACKLQTYFTAKGLIDYFLVEEDPSLPTTGGALAGSGLAMASTSQEEGKLFEDLKADIIQASRDLDKEAEIVQDVEASRADRVPWLVHTGFPTHLQGLRDTEIMSSYALPRSVDDDDDGGGDGDDDDDDGEGEEEGGAGDTDIDLRRILAAAESTLRDAYKLCSDKSPDRKMTQQRAKRLSNFRSDDSHMSSAKASKFRSFKNESSLTSYFRITKQLLAYYYRVVYRDDGHFTREGENHVVPRDIIETTPLQRQAMEDVISALRRRDKAVKGASSCDKKEGIANRDYDKRDAELKHTIRKFYISLICQTVGSRPFRSAILSFCAMLSRKKALTRRVDNEQHKRCTWREPGNFNSNLSALTWTAQLILFDFVCFQKQDDEDGIPDLLDQMCKKYFQQMAETPFGHVLQWRLYLFAASRTSLTKHQARWSLMGKRSTIWGRNYTWNR